MWFLLQTVYAVENRFISEFNTFKNNNIFIDQKLKKVLHCHLCMEGNLKLPVQSLQPIRKEQKHVKPMRRNLVIFASAFIIFLFGIMWIFAFLVKFLSYFAFLTIFGILRLINCTALHGVMLFV